jgi:predicted lipoprotein with Yx(FWY)xxD motif
MSNPYTENAYRWLALVEVDYLTHFVKAWIPFNAWYRNSYPNIKKDRQAINEIKSNPNLFRDKLIALLNGSNSDCQSFKNRISELHHLLEGSYIPNSTNRITLSSIVVETNPSTVASIQYRRWTYKVELVYTANTNYTINTLLTDSNGSTKYTYTQNKFDISEIQNHALNSSQLNESQRNKLKGVYIKINPRKPISLITSDNRNGISAGDIFLINDHDKLAKGLIEIIYRLRNILFHGELNPSVDNKKIYEPAYVILRTLIQSLN